MKILYGVQGTGNGHIARARAMCQALSAYPQLDVDFLFSGREQDKYFSMEEFGGYMTRKGLTFITQKGKVDYWQTGRRNSVRQLWKEVQELDLSGYDLVLNDFEPVTAWAAKRQGKPCISISHQNAFRYAVPLKGASWFDKQVIRHFAPAQHCLGLHWYHFEQPLLPPIVHTLSQSLRSEDFILVYLPFESLEEISSLLFRFMKQRFICYHPDIEQIEQVHNIELRPLNHHAFQEHLHRCSGVMANGGFELPSEALSLGKKLLLKPLNGQFEQQSNVATLDILGLANVMYDLNAASVRDWLTESPIDKVVYPDVAAAIVEWVVEGNWTDTDTLSRELWDKVDFPRYISTY